MPPMLSSRPTSAGSFNPGSNGRSAYVLDFICLFTHDLRRKQKRWEDGRLKYHTFNKRVMVYDERGNFVGDLHWQREEEFDEGEEVQLERGGVIVQVMECVGRQEQDLSELLDKRAKEKEQRQARVMMRPSLAAASPNTPLAAPRAQDHFQTRHRPLNHLLGTPTGHHGRALVPNESPFELRQKANGNPNDRTESRPLKRRKREITPPSKVGYAQSLFGATLSLSAVPISSAPSRQPASSAYRPQSLTSSQEEAGQNSRHVLDDRGFSGGSGSRDSSFTAKEVVPPPKAVSESNQSTTDEVNETFCVKSRNISRPRPVDAIQNRRQSAALQPTDANNRRLASNDGKPSPTSNRRAVDPLRSKRTETTRTTRNPRPTTVTNRTETIGDDEATIDPEVGNSRSQAIVLNEDPNSGPDAGVQPYQRQEEPSNATEPRRGAQSHATKPSKRSKSLHSTTQLQPVELRAVAAQDESLDEPQNEERTELRLKPRQKRGLLLLSEKRNRPRQNKRQDALARGPNSTNKSVKPPIISTAIRPGLATDLETTNVVSMEQRDQSLESPAVAPEILIPEPHALRPPSSGDQGVPLGDDSGCETIYPMPCTASASSVPPAAKSVDQSELDRSESPKPAHNSTPSVHDGTTNLSASPRGRRAISRGKDCAPVHNEPNRPSDFDPEEHPTNLALEPTISRPPRQTRKANLDDHGLGRSKKKARREESADSGGEEIPQPRVKPRLAKLSRKSIRSREVFGFVPSSPPVSNTGPTTVSIGGFHSTTNDSTGDDSFGAPLRGTFPVPGGVQPSLGEALEAQTTLPQKALPRAPSPTSPQRGAIPGTRSGEGVVEGSGEDQAATSTELQSVPATHRSPAHHISDGHSGDGGKSRNTNLDVGVPHPSNSTLEKEAALSTTTLRRAGQEQSPVPDNMALRSQLHEPPPKQPEWPMEDVSDIGVGPSVTRDATDHLLDAPAVGPTRPRITNPATRGRKAALKSDAAGQVPQSIVPVEPIPARRPPAAPQPEPATSERPKRKMRFPGFASAKGGGPWSREAHDLLESGRPG